MRLAAILVCSLSGCAAVPRLCPLHHAQPIVRVMPANPPRTRIVYVRTARHLTADDTSCPESPTTPAKLTSITIGAYISAVESADEACRASLAHLVALIRTGKLQ